jgi:hypothetical protein
LIDFIIYWLRLWCQLKLCHWFRDNVSLSTTCLG